MLAIYKVLGILCASTAVFIISYQYNKRLLDWLRFQSLGTRDYIVDKLNVMFIEASSEQVLLALFLMSFGLGGAVFLLLLPQVIPGLMVGTVVMIMGWKAPKPIVDFIYRRRVRKVTLQMVDALGLMANGLRSGLSIVQALGMVTQEMPNPIRQEFNLILSENRVGVSLEEAMNGFSKRVQSDDVEMFATAINILKETGGNLADTFDTIVNTIRERIRVQGKIESMTQQGFMQGMMAMCVPPALGIIVYNSDPEFMKPLFTTTMGWLILMVVLGLEIIAFFIIMKIIKIEV